jgi:hypothetical protein
MQLRAEDVRRSLHKVEQPPHDHEGDGSNDHNVQPARRALP